MRAFKSRYASQTARPMSLLSHPTGPTPSTAEPHGNLTANMKQPCCYGQAPNGSHRAAESRGRPKGIADALETLTGTARLSFNALSDTPTSVGTFDLYGDVTAETATPPGGDRFVMADVSVSGEPNRYLTFTNLKSAIGFDLDEDVTSETSALTTQDKFLISDVSNTGNPNHFVTGATAALICRRRL